MEKLRPERLSDSVLVKLTPSERERVERAANTEGLSLSAWARAVLVAALSQEVVKP